MTAIAWFAAGSANEILDDTPSLCAELAARHPLDIYRAHDAHDFVWRQFRSPADICVYELRDEAKAAFVWPYLLHYPGVLRLRSASVRHSRAQALRLSRRFADDRAEVAYTRGDRLRIPILASRMVIVGDAAAASVLQERYPEARIRWAPPAAPERPPSPSLSRDIAQPTPQSVLRVAAAAHDPVVAGAVRRARAGGVEVSLAPLESLESSDAVAALQWPPPPELPPAALAAMRAGRPPIVYESAVTAAWPALDPQSWQPRGFGDRRRPVVIALDARDAEHSLFLALRRLGGDPALRAEIGAAGRDWTAAHANVAHAARSWEELLAEAAATPPPPLPADWPPHLRADGTERARELLHDFGVELPF